MTKQDILNYVMNSPENTNPAILSGMLGTFVNSNNLDTSDATTTAGDKNTGYWNTGNSNTGDIAQGKNSICKWS